MRIKYQGVIKETREKIISAIDTLKKDTELGSMTRAYCDALRFRFKGNINNNTSIGAFFYLQGLAAFLTRIPTEYVEYDELRTAGIRYMSLAADIAPRLSKRDILMAGTYIYLKGKEELLCR